MSAPSDIFSILRMAVLMMSVFMVVLCPAGAQATGADDRDRALQEFLSTQFRRCMLDWQHHREQGMPLEEYRFDWSREMDSLAAVITGSSDNRTRESAQFAWLFCAANFPKIVDSALLQTLLTTFPVTSSFWALSEAPSVRHLARVHDDRTEAVRYFESVASTHPAEEVRSRVLYELACEAFAVADTDRVNRYNNLLAERYPHSRHREWAQQECSCAKQIQIGRPVPDFLVRDVNDSTRLYSNAGLRGTYYLIDFWFVACRPCVAEMPFLHEAYRRFHDKGLEILSVNVQKRGADMEQFRKQWPMPWLHVQHMAGPSLVTVFEAVYFPRTILVGPDGVIVAIDEQLRGRKLVQTLEKLLGEGAEER